MIGAVSHGFRAVVILRSRVSEGPHFVSSSRPPHSRKDTSASCSPRRACAVCFIWPSVDVVAASQTPRGKYSEGGGNKRRNVRFADVLSSSRLSSASAIGPAYTLCPQADSGAEAAHKSDQSFTGFCATRHRSPRMNLSEESTVSELDRRLIG